MNTYRQLNNSLKTGILTILVSLIGFLVTIFLLFNGHRDIPLGIIFAGVVIGGLNILAGLLERVDEKNHRSIATIIMIVVRLITVAAIVVLLGFMNFRWEVKLFNIFSFVGVYIVSVIIMVTTFIREGRQK